MECLLIMRGQLSTRSMRSVRCRCYQRTWSNHRCYRAVCVDQCRGMGHQEVNGMHVGTNQTHRMITRSALSSRSSSRFPKDQGRRWSRRWIDKTRSYRTLKLCNTLLITSITSVYSNEFGAFASSPLASMQLVLQATSSPSGVKSTPHACRKAMPSSCPLKSSSRRTNASDTVGRYLHGRSGKRTSVVKLSNRQRICLLHVGNIAINLRAESNDPITLFARVHHYFLVSRSA